MTVWYKLPSYTLFLLIAPEVGHSVRQYRCILIGCPKRLSHIAYTQFMPNKKGTSFTKYFGQCQLPTSTKGNVTVSRILERTDSYMSQLDVPDL